MKQSFVVGIFTTANERAKHTFMHILCAATRTRRAEYGEYGSQFSVFVYFFAVPLKACINALYRSWFWWIAWTLIYNAYCWCCHCHCSQNQIKPNQRKRSILNSNERAFPQFEWLLTMMRIDVLFNWLRSSSSIDAHTAVLLLVWSQNMCAGTLTHGSNDLLTLLVKLHLIHVVPMQHCNSRKKMCRTKQQRTTLFPFFQENEWRRRRKKHPFSNAKDFRFGCMKNGQEEKKRRSEKSRCVNDRLFLTVTLNFVLRINTHIY